jgi:hypothetical protein
MKYDRLISIQKDAVLDMPAHRPGEDNFFQVPALLQQMLQRIAM